MALAPGGTAHADTVTASTCSPCSSSAPSSPCCEGSRNGARNGRKHRFPPPALRSERRPPAGLTLFALFLARHDDVGIAWSLPVLVVGRVLEACGGCAGMVLGRDVVHYVFDRERSASAIATITLRAWSL
jgi:hypothetical protein